MPNSIVSFISPNRSFIMGLAMMSILLFHQPFFYGELPYSIFWDFFHLYGAWGVEVFLFLSGLGIAFSLSRNTIKKYYFNRVKRLIPICLIVGSIKLLLLEGIGVNYYYTNDIFCIVTSLYQWFIYVIIIYYAIAPILMKLIHRWGWSIFFIITSFCLVLNYTVSFDHTWPLLIRRITWAIPRFPVFLLGMTMFIKPLNLTQMGIIVIGIIAYILAMIFQVQTIRVSTQWDGRFIFVLIMVATPMICVLCTYLSRIIERNWFYLYSAIKWIGYHTLELYLIHEAIYKFFFDYVNAEYYPYMSPFIMFVIFAIASILR